MVVLEVLPMKRKHWLLLVCAIILVPLALFAASIVAGTVVPIGTFKAVEKQKLVEQKRLTETGFEKRGPVTSTDSAVVTDINMAGTVRVNNFG